MPAFVLAGSAERAAGILMIPAALLLAGAASFDVGSELPDDRHRRFFNALVAIVALLWLVFAVAMVAR